MIENKLLRIARQIGGFIVLVAIQKLSRKHRVRRTAPILVVIDRSDPNWRRN